MIADLPIGSRVHVVAGSFIGMTGYVISAAEAKMLHDENARALRHPMIPQLLDAPGRAWIALTIFERQVPVELEAGVLKLAT